MKFIFAGTRKPWTIRVVGADWATENAASGFKRVLEVVDGVMRGRGWLVEDEEKWKALCEVVAT